MKSNGYIILNLVILSVCFGGCGTEVPFRTTDEQPNYEPVRTVGKADGGDKADGGNGSCKNFCGKQTPTGCWCDDLCSSYDNCCSDKTEVCDSPTNKCVGITCTLAAPECVGDDLITTIDSTCDPQTGKCADTTKTTACVHGCEQGACNVEPPAPFSLFDDTLLSGTPIGKQTAVSIFAPGTTSAPFGKFMIGQRMRTCNTVTGCDVWQYPSQVVFAYMTYELWIPGPGWSPQKSCFQFKTGSFAKIEGTLNLVVGSGGQIDLELASNATGNVTCADVTSGKTKCEKFSSSGMSLTGGQSCNLPNPSGSGSYPDAYPTSVILYKSGETDGNPIKMVLLVTEKYVYGRHMSKSIPEANGTYQEVEYALYGATDGNLPSLPPSCVPTTCSAEGKTCGSIPDGCGQTFWCGSCSYPYSCKSSNT
ncbi:MAG: hypothetical protein V1754_02665, partial [Pseudomonadota bacterium]